MRTVGVRALSALNDLAPPKYDFDGLLAARRIELAAVDDTLQSTSPSSATRLAGTATSTLRQRATERMSRAGIERCLEILAPAA